MKERKKRTSIVKEFYQKIHDFFTRKSSSYIYLMSLFLFFFLGETDKIIFGNAMMGKYFLSLFAIHFELFVDDISRKMYERGENVRFYEGITNFVREIGLIEILCNFMNKLVSWG